MNSFSHENRSGSRRFSADRRSSIEQRRTNVDRRATHRREFVVPVKADERTVANRRSGLDRRDSSDRRRGITRRFDERRRRAGVTRVLVVDGREQVRAGIRRVMNSMGYEVVDAHEGTAGLTFYRETPVNLAIVNLTLPDMDGVEFIRQLRDTFPSSKVIAIAPPRRHGVRDPLALATGLGEIHELRWPFEPDDLKRAVGETLLAD